jgi:hypothetical protein
MKTMRDFTRPREYVMPCQIKVARWFHERETI